MFQFWTMLIQFVTRPFAAIFARQVIADAEIHSAMGRAESLRSAYDKADRLESEGFPNLAQELRESADAIAVRVPGAYSLEYFDQMSSVDREAAAGIADQRGKLERSANAATSSTPEPNGLAAMSDPKKRKRGRPRKSDS